MATSETSASRVEEVAGQLRERIFHGSLSPGTALRELVIAREFGVSQTTVREALRKLEHAGLVSKQINRGSTVTRLSARQIRERVTLRAMLEAIAAQGAAPRMQDEQFEELERRLAVLNVAVQSDSYYEAAQADLAFHHYVWVCSGNETLCNVLELITIPLFAFISILRSQGVQRLTTVVDAHSPLVAALRSGDPEIIRGAFETGATASYRNFLQQSEDQAIASALGYLNCSEQTMKASAGSSIDG